MDKSKVNEITVAILNELCIGMIFYTSPATLTLDELSVMAQEKRIITPSLHTTVSNLVSHGIVSAKYLGDYQMGYFLTDFGQYFFSEVCKTNEAVANFWEALNETNGAD